MQRLKNTARAPFIAARSCTNERRGKAFLEICSTPGVEQILIFIQPRGRVVPMSIRMRHTKGHTRNRRSHHALEAMTIVKDKESGNLRLPHRVDEATGVYRGKQIFTPKMKKAVKGEKVKGASTAPVAEHAHDHTHEHANAEAKASKGIFGKIATGGRPKARSGMGGQAGG